MISPFGLPRSYTEPEVPAGWQIARDVSAGTLSASAQTITQPVYLLEMGFSPVVYWSTRGTQTWNGIDWTGFRVRVSGPRTAANGEQDGSLSISRDDETTALFWGQGVGEVSCKIWKAYGDGPYALDNVTLIFSGVLDGSSYQNGVFQIGYTNRSSGTLSSPRLFASQVSKHIPAKGTIIKVGTETYIVGN